MKRRTLLAAVAGVMVAGCTTVDSDDTADDGTASGNESGANETDDGGADDALSDAELIDQFRSSLENGGFERPTVERVDDGLDLGYDSSGPGETDVAAEIELVADGYTTAIERGLSAVSLVAIAYDPADGNALDSFAIETEWVDAYLSEYLEWHELLTRVAETFVSTESVDDGEGDADGENADEETNEEENATESENNETSDEERE